MQAPRAPGPATLAELAGAAPGRLGTRSARRRPGSLRWSCWRPKVVLTCTAPRPTVQLAGGPTRRRGGVDPHRRRPAGRARDRPSPRSTRPPGRPMPLGPGRPFVSVGGGGRLLATDATFSDLGSPITEAGRATPGVGFAAGSNGSLVRTALLRNSTGLRLNGSSGVRLEGVLIAESAAARPGAARRPGHPAARRAGRAQRRQRRAGQRPEHGRGRSPASPPPATRAFGVAVAGQTAPRITGRDHPGRRRRRPAAVRRRGRDRRRVRPPSTSRSGC